MSHEGESKHRGPTPTWARAYEDPQDEKSRLRRDEHLCPHDFSDGDVCSFCDELRSAS